MAEPNFNNGIDTQGNPSTPTPQPTPALSAELPFTATPSSGIKTMPQSEAEMRTPPVPPPPLPQSKPSIPPPSTLDRALAHGEPMDIPSVLDGQLAIKPFPKSEATPVERHVEVEPPLGGSTSNPEIVPPTPIVKPFVQEKQEPLPSKINIISKAESDAQKESAIRTLESDIAQTVRGQGLSVADMALAEQKRKAVKVSEDIPETPKESSGAGWIVGTILFLLLGGGVIAGYMYLRPNTEVPLIETAEQAQFPADDRSTIDVSEMTFATFTAKIKEILTADVPLGSILSVSLAHSTSTTTTALSPLTTNELFTLIKSRAPSRLVRSLEDSFIFGVATVDHPTAFIMFKTNEFETTFAGMLEWEPFIAEDLPFITKELARPAQPQPIVATSTASSTPTTGTSTLPVDLGPQTEPEAGKFVDAVVKNEDVRALTLPDGTVRLLYSFPDKNTLIIARDKQILTLILERLSTARFTR